MRKKLPRTWRTADGRVLRIVDMSDDHLRNAMTFVERNIHAIRLCLYAPPAMHGEHAQDAADREWIEAMEAPVEDFLPYAALAREWRRREEAYAEIAAIGFSSGRTPPLVRGRRTTGSVRSSTRAREKSK